MRWLRGITEEYRGLNILNYELESGTLFKMGGVYGFAAACIAGVVAQCPAGEAIVLEQKGDAVANAILLHCHWLLTQINQYLLKLLQCRT